MFARSLAWSALGLMALTAVAPQSRADFALVSQDLNISQKAGTAQFSLTFNQAPDFTTVAANGTPANSFQVEFDSAKTPTALPDDLTAVIRGDEIHTAHAVRVRAPTGNGGPGSGGWGPVVTAVPFSLTGDTVSFTVPTADLGFNGGAWATSTYSLAYGDLTAQQQVSSVPAPPAFWGGLAGLVVVAGLGARNAATRRRAASGYFAG